MRHKAAGTEGMSSSETGGDGMSNSETGIKPGREEHLPTGKRA